MKAIKPDRLFEMWGPGQAAERLRGVPVPLQEVLWGLVSRQEGKASKSSSERCLASWWGDLTPDQQRLLNGIAWSGHPTLLEETKLAIRSSGHTPTQIVFIGSEKSGHSCNWAEFNLLADFEPGWGTVATDLIVVFEDGHKLWRETCEGDDWWSFSAPFIMPGEPRPIIKLVGKGLWESIEEIEVELHRLT